MLFPLSVHFFDCRHKNKGGEHSFVEGGGFQGGEPRLRRRRISTLPLAEKIYAIEINGLVSGARSLPVQ